MFSESGAGFSGQSLRVAEVSGRGEAAGRAQQVVHPSISRQRTRPEEDGRRVGQGDRRHFTESPRHMEDESLSDGQRGTPQLCKALNQHAQVFLCHTPVMVHAPDSGTVLLTGIDQAHR